MQNQLGMIPTMSTQTQDLRLNFWFLTRLNFSLIFEWERLWKRHRRSRDDRIRFIWPLPMLISSVIACFWIPLQPSLWWSWSWSAEVTEVGPLKLTTVPLRFGRVLGERIKSFIWSSIEKTAPKILPKVEFFFLCFRSDDSGFRSGIYLTEKQSFCWLFWVFPFEAGTESFGPFSGWASPLSSSVAFGSK